MKLIIIITLLFCICALLFKNYKEKFENHNIESKGFDSFDKYMYINLKHRKDRKKQIENELNKMDINKDKIIRIDAVREKYNGHIGCCKSHIKALKLAQKLNLNNVVILEDDFVFTEDKKTIETKLNHFLNKYKDFDVIMLTTINKNFKDINDVHIKKVIYATSPTAYIVYKNFYNTLIIDLESALKKMEKEMKEFDKKNGKKIKKHETSHAFDQHWFSLQEKSNWYSFFPYLGKDSHYGGSSIMGSVESFVGSIKESFSNYMYEEFFNYKSSPIIKKIRV